MKQQTKDMYLRTILETTMIKKSHILPLTHQVVPSEISLRSLLKWKTSWKSKQEGKALKITSSPGIRRPQRNSCFTQMAAMNFLTLSRRIYKWKSGKLYIILYYSIQCCIHPLSVTALPWSQWIPSQSREYWVFTSRSNLPYTIHPLICFCEVRGNHTTQRNPMQTRHQRVKLCTDSNLSSTWSLVLCYYDLSIYINI